MPPTLDAMTSVQPWTATEFGLRLAMWAVMMVATMVPTAAPMTRLYWHVVIDARDERMVVHAEPSQFPCSTG
jgi:predicted metal-binding membrane protein